MSVAEPGRWIRLDPFDNTRFGVVLVVVKLLFLPLLILFDDDGDDDDRRFEMAYGR
jgi:hypothetical protein